jgi:hypothetical protein
MSNATDVRRLRELARCYADHAADPVHQQRKALWTDHLSLRPTRPPITIQTGYWDLWCRQAFPDSALVCQAPLFREHEKNFLLANFSASWGDDRVTNPWVAVGAVRPRGWGDVWGIATQHESLGTEGSAWQFDPVIKTWDDVQKMSWPKHEIDEEATAGNVQRIGDAIGDILPVHRERGPLCQGFLSDIVTQLAQLRGLEQLMVDMLDEPEQVHRLVSWMRDGILANQEQAEAAGDLSTNSQQNQCMTYSDTTRAPALNCGGAQRKDLWAFCAAQELTGISPAMHDEFFLQYQKTIMEKWGLAAYGCCEDLTEKIGILRQVKNLRIIAVAPRANLARCVEQAGTDYVLSWRPNPADMVSCGFNDGQIRKTLREQLSLARGSRLHLNLKDVYTLEGDTTRLRRWVNIAREVINEVW